MDANAIINTFISNYNFIYFQITLILIFRSNFTVSYTFLVESTEPTTQATILLSFSWASCSSLCLQGLHWFWTCFSYCGICKTLVEADVKKSDLFVLRDWNKVMRSLGYTVTSALPGALDPIPRVRLSYIPTLSSLGLSLKERLNSLWISEKLFKHNRKSLGPTSLDIKYSKNTFII
mgnify:CR=1 FL=1